MKKAIAILMSLLMLIALTSCKDNEHSDAPESSSVSETQNAETPETTESTSYDDMQAVEAPEKAENSTEILIDEPASSADVSESTTAPSDPSEWTKEEIVEFYKNAAEKSNKTAKSTQIMVLNELIINDGDGALGFFIKILEPAIASVIEKNAFEFDGITGGFANLEASDAKNVKAYKSGKYTVIEMTMNNQTDGIYADAYAGSVGHAITVLGDVSKAVAEFPQFKVDFENADIKVNYVNATVRVRINSNGIIEKGTWKYTCDPEIRHLDISGIMIDKADAKIDYIITVGNGF